MAPSHGGEANYDPRVNVFLKWSAGLASPLLVAGLSGLFFLLVVLRDGQRDMNTRITLIMESDRKQNVYIEKNEESKQAQNREIDRLKDRVAQIQAHLGLR